jgi:hypothetical protein
VIPPQGLTWPTAEGDESLVLVGSREALVLARFADAAPAGLRVEALLEGEVVGSIELDPPSALPPTENQGPAFAQDVHSATLDAAWLQPGLRVRFAAPGHQPSVATDVTVGADTEIVLWTLPFYLYGADDDTVPLSSIESVDDAIIDEYFAKHPIADLVVEPHPASRVSWDYVVAGPRDGQPAEVWDSADDVAGEGPCAEQGPILAAMRAIAEANGDGRTNRAMYAPIVQLNALGEDAGVQGGCGGGGGTVGAGDTDYAGIFIHEMGHAYRLPHAAGSYDDGVYPYPGGSLYASSWGYDAIRREFLATFVSTNSESDCTDDPDRLYDDQDRCIKQDPMQSGSGDQTVGYQFTMFADYSVGRMQHYFSGIAFDDEDGERQYDEGRVFVDENSPTGYSRWDSLEGARVPVSTETDTLGLWGLDGELPSVRDVPVHTIVFTISAAETEGATQIYPPLSYVGNLRRTIDPTDPTSVAEIHPDTGESEWYCQSYGCDYTLRVTYESGAVEHVMIQGAFRGWYGATDPIEPDVLDPTNGDSFRLWAINVPGDEALTKIELLHTPEAWNGVPMDAPVLATRDP